MTRSVAVLLGVACLLAACAPAVGSPEQLAEAASTRSSNPPTVGEFGGFVPTQTGATRSAVPRPTDSPDLVIIAFSGHCGLVCHTRNTWSYLDSASEETGGVAVLDGIRRAYERLGLDVDVFSASSFVTSHYSTISEELEPGYLQAQAYLDSVKRDLITGRSDPTRVVLVGHSHGTVWASLLAMNNLDVTFDAFISLDAICWQWWARHRGFVSEAYLNSPWPIPYPLDGGDPCGNLQVPGRSSPMNINDVVGANVIFGLEVRTNFKLFSFDPNVLADDTPNLRINGTAMNIWGIEATEDHSQLGRYYNQSIAWVTSMIGALGVPERGAYPMSTFVLPPAPDEFGYQSGLYPPPASEPVSDD
jgi:hypothetical protein